jgi:hypothetical protein
VFGTCELADVRDLDLRCDHLVAERFDYPSDVDEPVLPFVRDQYAEGTCFVDTVSCGHVGFPETIR